MSKQTVTKMIVGLQLIALALTGSNANARGAASSFKAPSHPTQKTNSVNRRHHRPTPASKKFASALSPQSIKSTSLPTEIANIYNSFKA